MVELILAGALGGLAWAVLGTVAEKTKQNSEDFNWQKFVKSLVIGGAIGAILTTQGGVVSAETIEQFVAESSLYAPLVAITDKGLRFIYNLLAKVKRA